LWQKESENVELKEIRREACHAMQRNRKWEKQNIFFEIAFHSKEEENNFPPKIFDPQCLIKVQDSHQSPLPLPLPLPRNPLSIIVTYLP